MRGAGDMQVLSGEHRGIWGYSIVRSVVSQCMISLYVLCLWVVWCCGRYTAMASILDPDLGGSKAMARYGWC